MLLQPGPGTNWYLVSLQPIRQPSILNWIGDVSNSFRISDWNASAHSQTPHPRLLGLNNLCIQGPSEEANV